MERTPIQRIELLKVIDLNLLPDELTKCIQKTSEKRHLKLDHHILINLTNVYLCVLFFADPKQKKRVSSHDAKNKTELLVDKSPFKIADKLNKSIVEKQKENYFLIDVQFIYDETDGFIISAIYEHSNLFGRI